MGVFNRVAHTGLRCQVNDAIWLVFFEGLVNQVTIFKIAPDLCETAVTFNSLKSGQFQIDIIVVVDIINTDYFITALQQSDRQCGADKSRCACYKYFQFAFRMLSVASDIGFTNLVTLADIK